MHSCIVLQSLQYHPNVVSLSFRCRFIPRDITDFFAVERPKNDNISRCRVVSFQNEEERHKVLVRGNDRNAVGTTHRVRGRRTERRRRMAERWKGSGQSGPRSCRSDLVPRSRDVPNRSRRKGCIGTTPERGRNWGGGWAKVGVFPPKKSLIPATFHYRSNSTAPAEAVRMRPNVKIG